MPTLEHSLGSLNQRNIQRRQERARMVIQRLPVELSGCVIGLRKQRLALEKLFAEASTKGDSSAACRISDSLVRIAQTFHNLGREKRTKRGRGFGGEYPVPVEAQVIGPAESLERVG